ncbi:MAG: helix-turn-helix domain-containing protein [Bryobacteraceae bacterium]
MKRHLDGRRYRRLVAEISPVIIESEEENERVLAIVERLMSKGEKRSAEEDAILNLLVHLVEQFEGNAYPTGEASPAETIAFLLEQRGLRPVALAEVLGSRGRVSEILAAKRSVSKEQAKKLGEFFHVSAAAFL